MRWMRCCLNPKVIAGLVIVGVAMWLFAPAASEATIPVLIGLICPLSMAVMMWQMRRGTSTSSPEQSEHVTDVDAELSTLREELAIARARRQLRVPDPPIE